MERREAPGVCETPCTPLAIGACPRALRMGLRGPPRGARALRWRVCEARRPEAAPPGAPPRGSLAESRTSLFAAAPHECAEHRASHQTIVLITSQCKEFVPQCLTEREF